jgi:hypothetical protein
MMNTRTEPIAHIDRPRSGISIPTLTVRFLAVIGSALLILNAAGFILGLRASDVDDYGDFARPATLPFDIAMARLSSLNPGDKLTFVTEATRIFHQGMAHVTVADIERNGLDHYRMRVPAWENYLLYALSYLKPDTYRDYEFCNYRKALERGTGRCGQQSLALVSFLSSHKIPTGFVALGGHAIATAEVAKNQWYLLDPDFGGVIPYDIKHAEANPPDVLQYYWGTAASERRVDKLFYPDGNELRYGGPEARYRRACPIESVAYVLKWAIPVALIIPFLVLAALRAKGKASINRLAR